MHDDKSATNALFYRDFYEFPLNFLDRGLRASINLLLGTFSAFVGLSRILTPLCSPKW